MRKRTPRNGKDREPRRQDGEAGGLRKPFFCDSDQGRGTRISKMSHQHSSGQATICQASPAAGRTLNIGPENVSFRTGLDGRGGRWRESAGRAEPLRQVSQPRSSASPYLQGPMCWLSPLKVKFPFLQRTRKKFFFLSKANSPKRI